MADAEVGLARANNVTQEFLEQCDAVAWIQDLNDDWFIFMFNPDVEVEHVVPNVWFQADQADQEGIDAMNAYLARYPKREVVE